MSRFAARGVALVSLVLSSSVAFAQAPSAAPAPAAPAGTGAPQAAPAGAAEAPADPAKPGEPPRKVRDAGGYSFSDKPAPRRARGVARRVSGPVATLPGFEQLPDGGSRVFVQLSTQIPVEERKAQGSVTYVLKGAHVQVHNNTNALVTVHFNTPVSRARLVPSGNDLLLVIDLRAAAQPTWKLSESQDKSAMLVVDFPKGDFLPSGDPEATTEAAPERPEAAGTKTPGKGAGKPSSKKPKKGVAPPPPAAPRTAPAGGEAPPPGPTP